MKLASLIVLGSMILSTAASAYHGGVIKLGMTKLLDQKDVDVLTLGECRQFPAFANKEVKAVKVKVTNRAAEIDTVILTYGNGQRDVLELKEFFAAGDESRWIDLPNLRTYGGATRCIRSIKIMGDAETYVNSNAPQFQSNITFLGLL